MTMKGETISLQLPASVFEWIEQARGQTDRSIYITQLLQQQIEQSQREGAERMAWLAEGRKQYTPEVCQQTLQINDELPVHEE